MSGPRAAPLVRHQLANGLRLVLHVDRRLPLVALNLWYHVGSKHERPGRTGFAHLFEHMLFQGSAHVETNGHFRHLQSIGGVANGSTWYDRTNYYETVPSGYLERALWLESDRMGFLLDGLDQAKLDNQREVVLNERRQTVDNRPYGRPYEHLIELLIPADHPYHWPVIGYPSDVEAATLEDVREFFRIWYTPANAVLTLAGDLDPDAVIPLVEGWFGDLPAAPPPPRRTWPLASPAAAVAEQVSDRVRLPRVYLAFRTPPFGTDAWFAGNLLTAALAGGRSSPLYRDLVWDRQLAQETGVHLYPTAEVGMLVLSATARPGIAPARLAAELRRHVARVAEEIEPEALERARNRTLADLWSAEERLDERADRLSQYATFFDRPELAWVEAERYEQLSSSELTAFAEEFLADDASVELTVVPDEPAA